MRRVMTAIYVNEESNDIYVNDSEEDKKFAARIGLHING